MFESITSKADYEVLLFPFEVTENIKEKKML